MKECALAKSPKPNPILRAHIIALEVIFLAAAIIEGIKYLLFLIHK